MILKEVNIFYSSGYHLRIYRPLFLGKVSVHESNIRQTLYKGAVHGRKPLLSNRNTAKPNVWQRQCGRAKRRLENCFMDKLDQITYYKNSFRRINPIEMYTSIQNFGVSKFPPLKKVLLIFIKDALN